MKSVASPRTAALAALGFALCAPGCSRQNGNGEPDAALDGGGSDAASGSADAAGARDRDAATGDAADAAPDGADAAEPSPCTPACDRVVQCAIEACSGIDSRTESLARAACNRVCVNLFAKRVLDAPDCEAVMSHARRQSLELVELCDADICLLACEHYADCAVESCPNFTEMVRPDITADCMNDCTDPSSGEMLNASCPELMAARTGDERFMQACQGPVTCVGEQLCIPYAAKVSDCLVERCNGNADPFAAGLEEALLAACLDPRHCVTNLEAERILDDAVGCDSSELDNLASDPAYEPICAGAVGVGYEELVAVCSALRNCGIDLGSLDTCAVALATDSGAASMVECVGSSAGCLAIFTCLPEP
jgi:hypothetical protein